LSAIRHRREIRTTPDEEQDDEDEEGEGEDQDKEPPIVREPDE
jgi:hypothetical protein